MKLNMKILLSLVIGSISITSVACGNNSNKNNNDSNSQNIENNKENEDNKKSIDEILAEVNENMKNIKSYSSKTVIDGSIRLEDDDINSNISITADTDFIYEPLYINKKLYDETALPNEQNSNMYVIEENDELNVYNSIGGQWTHTKYVEDDAKIQINRLYKNEDVKNDIENILLVAKDMKIEEYNDDGFKIKAVIPSENVYDIVNDLNVFFYIGFSGYGKESYQNVGDVEITFDIDKKGYVKQISCDLKNVLQIVIDNIIKSIPDNSDVMKLISNRYTINIFMSDFNNIEKSDIPDDIKSIDITN